MTSLFHTLQTAVAERLEKAEWLGAATPPVRVAAESRGDLKAQINAQMARLNLAIIVSTPDFGRVGDHLSQGISITVGVEIIERPLANRGPTGVRRDYLTVALEVIALLEGFVPGPGHQPMRIESGSTLAGGDAEEVGYQLEFSTVVRVAITS